MTYICLEAFILVHVDEWVNTDVERYHNHRKVVERTVEVCRVAESEHSVIEMIARHAHDKHDTNKYQCLDHILRGSVHFCGLSACRLDAIPECQSHPSVAEHHDDNWDDILNSKVPDSSCALCCI